MVTLSAYLCLTVALKNVVNLENALQFSVGKGFPPFSNHPIDFAMNSEASKTTTPAPHGDAILMRTISHNPNDDGTKESLGHRLRNLAQRDLIANNTIYPEVRAVVENTDDPTLPVGTSRAFFLGTMFVLLGTSIEQFFSLRIPTISLSTYMVQLLSLPLGMLSAKMPTNEGISDIFLGVLS